MEDATTYTYKYEKENDKPERSLKVYFAVIIVVFFIAAVVAGIVTGKIKAKKEAETTTVPVTEAPVTEVTEPAVDDTYKPGTYSVNTGDVALRFRAEHNKDAEAILEIADKTKLDITEIFVDENATDEVFRYWGKTKYLGHTGWITMKYLKKEYSDDIVTPDKMTDATAETTAPTSTEAATAGETTTAGTQSATSAPKYTAGNYKVATGGSTLRFKEKPGRETKVLENLADGTAITVTEIVEINDTDDVYRYWGKFTYNGQTGYASMAYLAKQ